jgi:hypothetical protein
MIRKKKTREINSILTKINIYDIITALSNFNIKIYICHALAQSAIKARKKQLTAVTLITKLFAANIQTYKNIMAKKSVPNA